MTSTFPNEWLQPLVNEKIAELNREAKKDFVTVEKKVFDVLQKNNLDLMAKMEKTKEALQFYGEKREYQAWIGVGRNKERRGRIWKDNGKIARKTLKEIEK